MKFSQRNLIWLVIVVAATAIAWVTLGWKIGILAGVIALAISEIVERRARASAAGVVAEHR